MYHYRKTFKKYKNRSDTNGCPFCEEHIKGRAVRETKHSIIITNLTSYDVWEFRDVTRHLMVIPKRHVKSLNELSQDEMLDIMALISEYQSENYNIYARAIHSISGSVEHQHTHLIKTKNDRRARGAFFIRKPYWLFKF